MAEFSIAFHGIEALPSTDNTLNVHNVDARGVGDRFGRQYRRRTCSLLLGEGGKIAIYAINVRQHEAVRRSFVGVQMAIRE